MTGQRFAIKDCQRKVTRLAVVARAKPFERLPKFKFRIEQASRKCLVEGKQLEPSGVYEFKLYPCFRLFGKWVKFPIWTTKLEEQHYA